jgi:hypothetical protein
MTTALINPPRFPRAQAGARQHQAYGLVKGSMLKLYLAVSGVSNTARYNPIQEGRYGSACSRSLRRHPTTKSTSRAETAVTALDGWEATPVSRSAISPLSIVLP